MPELQPDDRCKTSETLLINWICRNNEYYNNHTNNHTSLYYREVGQPMHVQLISLLKSEVTENLKNLI